MATVGFKGLIYYFMYVVYFTSHCRVLWCQGLYDCMPSYVIQYCGAMCNP